MEPLLRFASHFHARGACKGKLQAPSKENTIDYPHILRAMNRVGYRGYVALEYVWTEWMRCNEVDNLTETIWLRDLLRSVEMDSWTQAKEELFWQRSELALLVPAGGP